MVQGRRRKPSYKSDYIASVPRKEWFVVANTHEAIIETSVFETVQKMILAKREGSAHRKGIN